MSQHEQDFAELARLLLQQNQQLASALAKLLPPATPGFVLSDLQRDIMATLNGKAMRTDALCHKVAGGSKGTLYRPVGGLMELLENGMVANHPRVGYYRPDAPPPDLKIVES